MNAWKQRTFTAVSAALLLGLVAMAVSAESDDQEIPFDVAEVFFELNDTDGDLGIHALIDGEPWKELEIEDARGREILEIDVKRRLKRQGLTEIFFESAEPTFDELPPKRFFRRFPAGTYEVEGETLEGEELESETEVTHVMPAPPGGVTVSGVPVGEDCDEAVPTVDEPVVIEWDPVTTSHPDLGAFSDELEVLTYQVVVEEEESELVMSVLLPPDATSFEVPADFLSFGEEFKYEILVREASYNQTALESCFALE